MIRARNNTIIVEPTYEPQTRLSPLASTGETIDSPLFGKVKVHGSQDYVNTAPGNNIAWGRVVSSGPGAAWMEGRYDLTRRLAYGDIIGFDVQHEVSLPHEGRTVFFLPVEAALCRYNESDPLPVPLGVHVLTRFDQAAIERFVFSAKNKHRLHMPRNATSGTLKVSDSPWSNVRFAVERVVAVGTGGMAHSEIRTEVSVHEEIREQVRVNGETMGSKVISSKVIEKRQSPVRIIPDPEAVGSLAIFLYAMSVDVTVQGVRHRLTNWDRVRGTVADDEAQTESETAA